MMMLQSQSQRDGSDFSFTSQPRSFFSSLDSPEANCDGHLFDMKHQEPSHLASGKKCKDSQLGALKFLELVRAALKKLLEKREAETSSNLHHFNC